MSIGWIIHQIFHYCHCPSCKNRGFPTILKCILKSFFLESHFIGIMIPQRDGGSMSLLCPVKPKHMYLTITGISGTVIIVLSSLLSPTKTSSCSSGPCLHSEGCQMHPAVPCLQTFELLDVILSCFSFLIHPAAPHHCSHSRSEDASLGSGISLGAPQDTLAGESHGRGRHQCDRESLLLSVTKTPCALPGGNSLVALYRKKLENSEVMVRKISPSPYFRRHSYLNPPKTATTAREKLHSGTQNPFLAQHC